MDTLEIAIDQVGETSRNGRTENVRTDESTDGRPVVITKPRTDSAPVRIDNGTNLRILFIVVYGGAMKLLDFIFDWLVAVETASSQYSDRIFGNVLILERNIGFVMVAMMLVAGFRVALAEFEALEAWVRIPLAILLSPVATMKTIWLRIKIFQSLPKDQWGLLNADPEINRMTEMLLEADVLVAKWECGPQMFLTCLKLGLAHKLNLIDFISILTSVLWLARSLVSLHAHLRRKSRETPHGFAARFVLVVAVAFFVLAGVIAGAVFSFESERDGVFGPHRRFADEESAPGLLFICVVLPLILTILSLASVPHLTFGVVRYDAAHLQALATPMSDVMLLRRFSVVSLTLFVNAFSSIFFVYRDNYPDDDSIFLAGRTHYASDEDSEIPWARMDFKIAKGRWNCLIFHWVLLVMGTLSAALLMHLVLTFRALHGNVMYRVLYIDLLIAKSNSTLDRMKNEVSFWKELHSELTEFEEEVFKQKDRAQMLINDDDEEDRDENLDALLSQLVAAGNEMRVSHKLAHYLDSKKLRRAVRVKPQQQYRSRLSSLCGPTPAAVIVVVWSVAVALLAWGAVILTTPRCPDGFNHFLPIKGKCYAFEQVDEFIDFPTAKKRCVDESGILAEIYSQKELDSIEEYLQHMRNNSRAFWTGMTRMQYSPFVVEEYVKKRAMQPLVWNSTRLEPSYSIPWQAGNPNGYGNCVDAFLTKHDKNLLFNDLICNCDNCLGAYLCKYITPEQRKDLGRKKFPDCDEKYQDFQFKDSCYHYEQSPGCGIYWETAQEQCEANGGHLAAFETKEEWIAVKEFLVSEPSHGGKSWIGANVTGDGDRKFRWVTGDLVDDSYGFLGSRETTAMLPGDCLITVTADVMDADQKDVKFGWFAAACSKYGLPFLCEKKKTSTM